MEVLRTTPSPAVVSTMTSGTALLLDGEIAWMESVAIGLEGPGSVFCLGAGARGLENSSSFLVDCRLGVTVVSSFGCEVGGDLFSTESGSRLGNVGVGGRKSSVFLGRNSGSCSNCDDDVRVLE